MKGQNYKADGRVRSLIARKVLFCPPIILSSEFSWLWKGQNDEKID